MKSFNGAGNDAPSLVVSVTRLSTSVLDNIVDGKKYANVDQATCTERRSSVETANERRARRTINSLCRRRQCRGKKNNTNTD